MVNLMYYTLARLCNTIIIILNFFRNSPVAMAHGKLVMDVVNSVVESLENYEKMWDLLIAVGRQHFCKESHDCSCEALTLDFSCFRQWCPPHVPGHDWSPFHHCGPQFDWL